MAFRLGGRSARRACNWLEGLVLAAAAAGLAWLAGCAPQPRLVVGIHPWVGYETLHIARELNWLPDAIQLRDGQTAAGSLAALQSGEVNAACLTLDEMLRARAAGIPLSAALVFDISAGADMVLARPEIKRLEDLAHKRIGYESSALGALVFEKLLEAAQLPAAAVTQVDLPLDRQIEAWRRHEVDAIVTYEPTATALLREGAHSLFDSRRIPDTIIDVLAVRRDRPELFPAVRALVAKHFRALDHWHTNEQDALYRISARQGISPDEVRRTLAGVLIPSLAANRAYLSGDDPRLRQAARTVSAVMVRRGLLAREDDLDQLIMPASLPSVER